MEQGSLPTLPAYPIKERLEINGVNVLLAYSVDGK